MNPEPSVCPSVLHVVPPNGGGVDRYVRGICTLRKQDWILHVSDRQWVVEHPAQNVLIPIPAGSSAIRTLAMHRLVHAHSALPETRMAVSQLSDGGTWPYLLTLHDIAFADTSAAISREERTARIDFVLHANHLVAPSHYMASAVRELS